MLELEQYSYVRVSEVRRVGGCPTNHALRQSLRAQNSVETLVTNTYYEASTTVVRGARLCVGQPEVLLSLVL